MYNKEDFEALRYPEYIWHFMHSDQPTSFLGFGDGYALSCHLACPLEDSPYCRLTCPPNYLDEELREFTNQLDCTPIINRWGGYEGLSSLYETFILKPLGHSFPTPWNEDCEKAIANMFAIKEALEISLDSLELRREELIKKTAWFATFGLGQAAMALAILSPGYPLPQSGGLILASLLLYAIAFFSMNATFNR